MNLQTYGRQLMEGLAERSLDAIRGTSSDDVRKLFGRTGHAASTGAFVGAALGAFAVGAAVGVGLTALYMPTSGPQLRKRLSGRAREARKEARELSQTVRSRIGDAGSSIARGVEQATTSVGLSSPGPRRKTTRRGSSANGRKTSSKRTSASHVRHAA